MIPYLLAIAGGYLIGSSTERKLFAKGGGVDRSWVIEFHGIKNDKTKVIRVIAKTQSEAIQKAYSDLSNMGEVADDYSVSYSRESKYANGGNVDLYLPVGKKVSQKEIDEFVDYVNDFYGKKGIYADDLNGGFTKSKIREAVMTYLNRLNSGETWGYADSVDRERVRMILDPSYSMI